MLIDLETEAAGGSYESQVCVLGAGIAGLIVARRLAARGVRVHLLEAGGLDAEERSQRLYGVEMAGERHAGATEGRFRVFGGSSTRWGGQLLPYTEDIFRPGAGMPSCPWQIGVEVVEGYYGEVLRMMGVGGRAAVLPFEGDGLLRGLGLPAAGFGDGVRLRFSKWAPFGRRNLAKGLGRECLASAAVTVFVHANAVELEERGGRVEGVRVKNYAGAEFTFRAEQFVVCLGTIESARLLLASGIAREHDQVGRYFHDHVGVRVARFEGEGRKRVLERLGPFVVEGTLLTAKLEAPARLRERERLPAVMAHVVIEEPEGSGVGAVREMLRGVQRGDSRVAVGRNLVAAVRGMGDVARLGWESWVRGRRAVSGRAGVWLKIDVEQVARAEDRVRLAEETDGLGMRRAVVDWRIGDEERAAVRAYARVVKEELDGVGIRGLTWEPGVLDGGEMAAMEDTFHAMGGLRMGVDARVSVVDTELKVHGVENLYVAGCGVFPGGGSSNPTFTMMALALRLGDWLAGGR